MQIINPATEQIIREMTEDNNETLGANLSSLKEAQPEWKKMPIQERAAILHEFSTSLEVNIEHLAAVLTSEVGKPLQQSRNEINGARKRIKWITENALQYLSDELVTNANGWEERISYEPLGVICNISAWNYPYLVGINVFVPALIAGNTVLYKPSEYASLTGLEMEKLLKQSGVPEDAFHVAIGAGGVGELLTGLGFDGFFFTGSYKTGKQIYEKLASKMIPCQCELGGKDPLYIADDVADITSVATATADGAFYNNGQSCCAVERIYVHENIYDRYLKELVNEVRSWKIGLPDEQGVYIGPLTRRDQLDVLQRQVDDAISKGAKLLTGGRRIDRDGFYFEPTVLVNVNHEMQVMKEESFGPVVGVMKVENDAQAVALMQDTEYGLTAAVYSRDKDRAERILQQINAGTGYWNCCDRVTASLPWTGRNHSGFGVTLSHAGLRAFVRPKAYHLFEG
ncbi:MAG: aldehyde dehydrogenase family protein [Chitinophagaceae bacterium]